MIKLIYFIVLTHFSCSINLKFEGNPGYLLF